jgi:hypothetical protein
MSSLTKNFCLRNGFGGGGGGGDETICNRRLRIFLPEIFEQLLVILDERLIISGDRGGGNGRGSTRETGDKGTEEEKYD